MFCHARAKHKRPMMLRAGVTGQTERLQKGWQHSEMGRLELHEIHDHPAFPASLAGPGHRRHAGAMGIWQHLQTHSRPSAAQHGGWPAHARCSISAPAAAARGCAWLASRNFDREFPGLAFGLPTSIPTGVLLSAPSATSSLLRFESSASRRNQHSCPSARLPHDLLVFPPFRPGSRPAHASRRDGATPRRGNLRDGPALASDHLHDLSDPVHPGILAPTIRPFRWSRLFWTWLIPLVPFVLFYDGIVSCLRAYSHRRTRAIRRAAEDPGLRMADRRGAERISAGHLPTRLSGRHSVEVSDYSIRNAVIGSRRDARHAGTAQATAATASSMMLTTAKTTGSSAVVP